MHRPDNIDHDDADDDMFDDAEEDNDFVVDTMNRILRMSAYPSNHVESVSRCSYSTDDAVDLFDRHNIMPLLFNFRSSPSLF
jgi:hypothetical protein